MQGFGVTGCGAGLVASIMFALVSATPTLGVDAAAGQTGPKTSQRTYDVLFVGSVTTTAPDVVWTEKATHTYRGVRIRLSQAAGRVVVGLVETPRAADTDTPNGAMRGEVVYQETGSTPCSTSKRFSGTARLEIFGSGGRSFYASGVWRGKRGGAELSRRDCPGLGNVQGINHRWLYEKGGVFAQLNAGEATFGWLLSRRGLPFPVNRVFAGRSFTASASGSMDDGFGVRKGSLRVTFTPRR